MRPVAAGIGAGLFSNPKMKTLFVSAISDTSTHNLTDPDTGSDYVVPVGREFCVYEVGGYASGASTTINVFENQNGTTIPVSVASSSANPSSSIFYCYHYTSAGVGTKVTVSAGTNASNANIWAEGIEADLVASGGPSSSVYTAYLPGGSTGVQTLYAVPSGTHAYILNRNPAGPVSGGIYCANIGGSSSTVLAYAVQNGGSSGPGNLHTAAAACGAGTLCPFGVGAGLYQGTFELNYSVANTPSTFSCWATLATDTGTH